MALFFDQAWFDAQLSARGLSRSDVASALRLTAADVAELWKDQRELRAHEVAALAALLGRPAAEIADRAGVSTPVPKEAPADLAALQAQLVELNGRMDRLERLAMEIRAMLARPD